MEPNVSHASSIRRTLGVLDLLQTHSDEKHPLTLTELSALLKEHYDITVHRITLTKDIAALEQCGVDVVTIHSTQNRYFIGERTFQLPELRLLIDAIRSSKCLSAKKSEELIEKICTLTSVHQADELKNRPFSETAIKPKNEQIYYIIDTINRAIDAQKMIEFHYLEYSPTKKRILRNDGETYTMSPYACLWNGDYYYVIGWCDKHQNVSAFRVDRIAAVPIVCEESVKAAPTEWDLNEYCRTVFHMYKGDTARVELQCDNTLMKTIIDRFGEDVESEILDDETFKITVDISLSPTFYGWLFEFGGKIRILSPDTVKNAYRDMLKAGLETL